MSAAMASRNSFLAFTWSGFFSSRSAGFLFASRIRCADSDTGACASRAARPAAPGVLTVLPGGTSAGPVGRGLGVVGAAAALLGSEVGEGRVQGSLRLDGYCILGLERSA